MWLFYITLFFVFYIYILLGFGQEPHMFIAKIGNTGNLIWNKTDGQMNDWRIMAHTVMANKDGDFIVPAYYEGLSSGGTRTFVYDKSGIRKSLITSDNFNHVFTNYYDMEKTPDGGFLLVGSIHNGGSYLYIWKLDYQGNILWSKEKSISQQAYSNTEAYSILRTHDNLFSIGGYTNGFGYGDVHKRSTFLMTIDENGNTVNSFPDVSLLPNVTAYDSVDYVIGKNWVYQISATSATNFQITNGSLSPGVSLDATSGLLSGSPTLSGRYEATIKASNSFGFDELNLLMVENGITEITSQLHESPISIFPNPTNSILKIKSRENEKIESIEIMNPYGEVINMIKEIPSENLQMDCQKFNPGNYVIRIKTNKNTYHEKIVVY